MSRSLLKLVLALLVVGVLPFATSLVVVDGLFDEAVRVGLNPEVQAHLERSAEVHRELVDIERLSHELAAEAVAADPYWREQPGAAESLEEQWRRLLERHRDSHPRLVALQARRPSTGPADDSSAEPALEDVAEDGAEDAAEDGADGPRVDLVLEADAPDQLRRRETRLIDTPDGPVEIALTFAFPGAYLDELESVGDTLRTFRALETLSGELSRDMNRTYLMFAGGAALLSLLLGTWLTRRTTTRIERIAKAAERVGGGDLTARVRDRTRDEIGELSQQFNRMVDELQASQDRVAYLQRVSAWQEIARRLAHEIKNPLTPILLAMQQLERSFERYRDEPARFERILGEALEIVQEEVETLRTLVKEFSKFGRMPEVNPEPLGVAGFVEDFVKTNPQLTQQARVHVEVSPDARRLRANLDSTLMRRVLTNLVQNAIEACTQQCGEDGAEGGEATEADDIDVALSVWADHDGVLVRIEDNGPGVDQTNLDRVFEPYFTTKKHGTGLGLPIVKKIVLDHGGRMDLENRTDRRGCRVTLTFPVIPGPSRTSSERLELKTRAT